MRSNSNDNSNLNINVNNSINNIENINFDTLELLSQSILSNVNHTKTNTQIATNNTINSVNSVNIVNSHISPQIGKQKSQISHNKISQLVDILAHSQFT